MDAGMETDTAATHRQALLTGVRAFTSACGERSLGWRGASASAGSRSWCSLGGQVGTGNCWKDRQMVTLGASIWEHWLLARSRGVSRARGYNPPPPSAGVIRTLLQCWLGAPSIYWLTGRYC